MYRRFFKTVYCLAFIGLVLIVLADVAFADDGAYRSLVKAGSLIAVLLGIVGISIAGFIAGRDYDSYTGWDRFTHGAGMFFNRKPFENETPTYEKTERHERLRAVENLGTRLHGLMMLINPPDGSEPKWNPAMGPEALPDPLKSWYLDDKEAYRDMMKALELMKKQQQDWPKWSTQFAVADSWSRAMGSIFDTNHGRLPPNELYPPDPQGPPEEWDFREIHREKPLPFKSPDHAARLIKKMTHTFGATLVGITKLNPDWVFQGSLRGVGPVDYDVPGHWEYAIVFATPHEWDMFYANPVYGSSFDAYSRERIIGARLEFFIQDLGYPARAHVPPSHYDLMTPPIAIDAGLGEQGRNGLLITPELGSNARLAVVTTNIPMTVDKPIDFGVKEFCSKCKICAETCPTGAITYKDEPGECFGYKRWRIKCELCFQVWCSMATSKPGRGCRVCLAVCPYSRKNNWLHSLSKAIDPRDPTGMVSTGLLWMQKSFFNYPKARDFMPPPQGKNATYHRPPDWLVTEEWFDVEKTW